MADETSIDVSKKSVADLLGSGSKSRFMIPEYQRPYAWGADQINTLFDDLTEYVKGDLILSISSAAWSHTAMARNKKSSTDSSV